MHSQPAHQRPQDTGFVLAMRPHPLQASRQLRILRIVSVPDHCGVLINTDTGHCEKVLAGAKMLLHQKQGIR